MSAFVLSKIFPSMSIDASQRFIFGLEESPEPLGSFKLDNIFVPTMGSPSLTNFEMRNEALSGYRWIHGTASDETYGSFKLQKFLEASPTGIDIMTFNDDGTFIIPGVNDAKYILQTTNIHLPNAQSLGALTTGLLKNTVTTGTGVLSTATPGVDYFAPSAVTAKLVVNGGVVNDPTQDSCIRAISSSSSARIELENTTPSTGKLWLLRSGGLGAFDIYDRTTDISRFFIESTGNIAIGNNAGINAKLAVFGGPQNVTNEDSVIMAVSSSLSAKIELQNTTPSTGKLYELRSNSGGTFSIFDRTTGYERFILNNDGSITCNGPSSGVAQFIVNNNDATNASSGYVFKHAGNTKATFYYDFPNNQLQIISIAGGAPLIFGTNGLEQMRLSPNGNLTLGITTMDVARIFIQGGVQNVASEESALRVSSGTNAVKIELNSSSGSGKLYEFRSNNDGSFGIFDRTSVASRLSIDTNGISTFTNNVLISTASASDVPLYQVGHSTDVIQLGYDGPNDYSFINIAGSSNDRLAFRVGGVGIAAFLSSGLFGFGTITPTQAKVVVSGGVQNIANEDSVIRALSSANVAKIELQCTNGSGKNYEFRSDNAGALSIFDRTAAASRLFISTSGNIGIQGVTSPNASLQFSAATANRKLVIHEAVNNDHEFKGFGHNSGIFRFQINQTADSYVFYAAANSTTSNELMRLSGTGNLALGSSTINLARLYLVGGVQNVANEDTIFRASSSANSAKIEIQNTTASKLFEIRVSSTGNFDITDRTAAATRITILSGGNTGIGTAAPDNTLSVSGTANKTGGGTWGSFSDSRIKDILGDYTHGLNEILQITPKIFKYKENSGETVEEQAIERIGVIAQDIEYILPECIEKRETKGFQDLRYYDSSAILYVLVNAVKELNSKIEAMKG